MATSTITHTVTDAAGSTLEGVPVVVTLMPAGGFRTSAGSEVSKVYRTVTDSSGQISVALERNADITPSGTYYQAEVLFPKDKGGTRKYLFQVGSSNQSLYASLITAPTAVTAATALTQAAGDARYVLSPGSYGGAVDISTIEDLDSASAGVLASYARSDHQHAFTNNYTVCTSATRPSSPSEGRMIYETDTNLLYVYDGSTWLALPSPGQPAERVISLTTLGSAASSISSGTLPTVTNGWQLRVVAKLQHASSTGVGVHVRFNSDSGSNYWRQYLSTSDTSVAGDSENTAVTWISAGTCGNASTNRWAMVEAVIPDYLGSGHKNVRTWAYDPHNLTAPVMLQTGSLWASTAAITSVTVHATSGNFVAGSTLRVLATPSA